MEAYPRLLGSLKVRGTAAQSPAACWMRTSCARLALATRIARAELSITGCFLKVMAYMSAAFAPTEIFTCTFPFGLARVTSLAQKAGTARDNKAASADANLEN